MRWNKERGSKGWQGLVLQILFLAVLVLGWGQKAKAEPFSLPSERDKEEMRMERSNRNGLFDRLKSREEERRLRQMPDERQREHEEQKRLKGLRDQ